MSEQWRKSPYTRHQEEKLAMFVKEFFFFDSLTPEESEKAVETFRNGIHLLGFDNWHRIPVVFSTRKGCERLRTTLGDEGFLVLPFDFEIDEATAYIKVCLPTVKQRREELVAKAKQDMLEVEAMKEQLKLLLGPKEIEIEPAVDRDARRARLAKYLIRASRAVDISMGYESEKDSILQNDYFQREQDQEFYDRREGNFVPKTLDEVVMLPVTDPPKFPLPPFLSLQQTGATPRLASSNAPSSNAPSNAPSTSTSTPTFETQPISTNLPAISNSGGVLHANTQESTKLNPYQPISSITPAENKIDSDESVLGPKLGISKDGIDSPAVRNGYTGLLLDLDEADRIEGMEFDRQQMNTTGAVQTSGQQTGIVSGDFYHTSSAMHCLQHLASLALTTTFKTDFPWHAIKIVISDHYHMDMTKAEPVLYVPSYFDEKTLRKFMEVEGGSKLLKITMDAKEIAYLLELTEKIVHILQISSLKISKGLRKSFEDQVLGLKKLEKCADVFTLLGDVSDLHVVLADRYATAQHFGSPKLFIPFDFEISELIAYMEHGKVPPRYAIRDRLKEEAEAKAALDDDSFFEEFADDEFDEEEEDEQI